MRLPKSSSQKKSAKVTSVLHLRSIWRLLETKSLPKIHPKVVSLKAFCCSKYYDQWLFQVGLFSQQEEWNYSKQKPQKESNKNPIVISPINIHHWKFTSFRAERKWLKEKHELIPYFSANQVQSRNSKRKETLTLLNVTYGRNLNKFSI